MKATTFKPRTNRKPRTAAGPIGQLNKLVGLIQLTVKRQYHHPGLAFLALLGILLTIGLITSAAFFSQGVDRAILYQEFDEFARITGRPPLSMRGYTFPSSRRPMSLQTSTRR
jgi:hypothetical protein